MPAAGALVLVEGVHEFELAGVYSRSHVVDRFAGGRLTFSRRSPVRRSSRSHAALRDLLPYDGLSCVIEPNFRCFVALATFFSCIRGDCGTAKSLLLTAHAK